MDKWSCYYPISQYLRASKYMKGVEIADSLIPGMREKILNKQVKVSKADMHRLA